MAMCTSSPATWCPAALSIPLGRACQTSTQKNCGSATGHHGGLLEVGHIGDDGVEEGGVTQSCRREKLNPLSWSALMWSKSENAKALVICIVETSFFWIAREMEEEI